MGIEDLGKNENTEKINSKSEKVIGSSSAEVEAGMKEARITFLEEKLQKDDSYENWLDLGRAIRLDHYAQTDQEYKRRLEDLLAKSKWQEWSDRMNNRDSEKADLLVKLQELTGIVDMRQNEELLEEYLVDPVKFAAKLNALKNRN